MKKLFIILLSCGFVFSQHFSVDIDETGESCLFIFEDSITSLEAGDEVGLFDENGIVDSNGNIGEILVGAGTWTGSQLEVVAIQGVNLSQFGGPILPGGGSGNSMTLKVWKESEETEYIVSYDVSTGSGTFDGLFTAISEINFAPTFDIAINEFFFRSNSDVPDYIELLNYGSESTRSLLQSPEVAFQY